MTQKRTLTYPSQTHRYLALVLCLASSTMLCFAYYVETEKQIDQANELRVISEQFVDELQQSTQELTRLSRTYVVTGDPKFKQHFQEIIEIRDGKRYRPEDYYLPYWSLIDENDHRPRPNSQQKIPFLDLLKQFHFTDVEINLLIKAKDSSDQLALIEAQAMSLREQSATLNSTALSMLFDARYHGYKREIMVGITEFYRLVETRTRNQVHERMRIANLTRWLLIALSSAFFLALYLTYRSINKTLGASTKEIHGVISKIGQGDFSSDLSHAQEGSILAWLATTQAQLIENNLTRNRLLAIVQESTDFIATINPNGQLTYLNPIGYQMLGLSIHDDPTQQTLAELFSEAYLNIIQETGLPYAQKDGFWRGESMLRQQDGAGILVSVLILAHRDNHQNTEQFSIILSDISLQKIAEMELRRFRTTLDMTKDCVFMFYPDSLRFFYANRGAEEQLGYTQDELLSMTPLNIKHGLDETHFRALLAPLLTGTQDSVTFETLHQHKDGRLIPVEVFVQYVAPTGETARFVNIVRDISERQKTQAQLEQQKSALQSILNNVVDAIITIDEHGAICSFNKAAETIFGYQAEEVLHHNINMLMPEPYQSQHDGYLANYMNTGLAKIIGIGREVMGLRKNGQTFPIDLAVSEAPTAEGRRFTGIVRDITERKRIERMKTEFVATVSHELRTPLTSIIGSLGLVSGGAVGELNPQAKALIELAQKNSKQLVMLINDILDLEKIQSGGMHFDMQLYGVMNLVRQAIASTEGYFSKWQNHCVLVREVSNDIQINVDQSRFLQVMANLLSNAAKFAPAGSTVEVGVAFEHLKIRIWVQDSGPGITPEFKKRMFERFSQADGSATRAKGGTGLGLSIVKEILAHMGGTIAVESELGQGAKFYFDLPFVNVSFRSFNPEFANILYIEDEQDNCIVLTQLVSDFANVVSAATLADARSLLGMMVFNLIILDLSLPDGDGSLLLPEISQLSPSPPVLVYSATEPTNEIRTQVNDVLVKTRMTPDELKQRILTFL